jgi:DMSO/TMAO reductase YedYZ molybdopterin-dependent catalytic subunit
VNGHRNREMEWGLMRIVNERPSLCLIYNWDCSGVGSMVR